MPFVNATFLPNVVDKIVAGHKLVKNANASDAECKKKVADTVCKATLLACSHDRTKVVALLSEQECYKNVGW